MYKFGIFSTSISVQFKVFALWFVRWFSNDEELGLYPSVCRYVVTVRNDIRYWVTCRWVFGLFLR